MHTVLMVVLPLLIAPLALALIAVAFRRRSRDDAMMRAIGDVPSHLSGHYWPRGGYAAMDEHEPIAAKRPI